MNLFRVNGTCTNSMCWLGPTVATRPRLAAYPCAWSVGVNRSSRQRRGYGVWRLYFRTPRCRLVAIQHILRLGGKLFKL